MATVPWYKQAIFYQVHVRAFCDSNGDGRGDLPGLTAKLDYFKELGVDCLWLMPLYPSPLRDDGYDIADFYGIHPDYGTLDDFRAMLVAARARGLRVIIDLVLNHTSDQHPWFQSARADPRSKYRDYYVWSDTDQKYSEARIIFLDSERSNWTWDPLAGQFYWHRFYASQPDLNFANPDVCNEMLKVMKFWLEMGADGFRVDAVPYLFERDGTDCENLPETHSYLKELRRFVDRHDPECILLCEANQWPRDVREYFGKGDEFHMGFHFPLMPRVFMAIGRGEAEPIRWALDQTPPIPENCQWCTFLRNHDELTLEMITESERRWMWDKYAPDPQMRINLGIRRRLAPLLDNDRRRIELANSLLFTLPGSPIIYYGDEIGMGDNIRIADRNGVRTPMQWDDSAQAGFSTAAELYLPVIDTPPYEPARVNVESQRRTPDSLWHTIRRMIAARKQHAALAHGSFQWIDCGSPAVAAYVRSHNEDRLLILNNLSDSTRSITVPLAGAEFKDYLSGRTFIPRAGALEIELEAYQFLWLHK